VSRLTHSVILRPSIDALRYVHSPFSDMACALSLAPPAIITYLRDKSTARPFRTMVAAQPSVLEVTHGHSHCASLADYDALS